MDLLKVFQQDDTTFTVFVVEQRFAVGQGQEYFKSFINKGNYIKTDGQVNSYLGKVACAIEKYIAPVGKLTEYLFKNNVIVDIVDAISALCKVFTVHEHQSAGPEVLDPIILQEGQITQKSFIKVININKDSPLRSAIIVILKDNDFERAKRLLSECPDGINLKFIRNSGETVIYKVVNCGADSLDSFINSFSQQCYSTCSKTRRDVLLNEEWSKNNIIKRYGPVLLKYRTNLLFDEKEEIKDELSSLIANLPLVHTPTTKDSMIIKSFECISKLFRVFCSDSGGTDISDAYQIAKDLNNEILTAQVYRYAEFFPGISISEKEEMYDKGYRIFRENSMEDLAIYCRNNKLIHQFYTNHVSTNEFEDLQIEACNNVPGMVGISHIYNNVGIAFLYNGFADQAIEFFNKGLDYARHPNRIVQSLALLTNRLIAESYSYQHIDESKFYTIMRQIMDGMGKKKLPFIAADYALNLVSVAYHQNVELGKSLLNDFSVEDLVSISFATNPMGAGERVLQLQYLDNKFGDAFPLLSRCVIPNVSNNTCGKREEFILHYGYNLFELETWL